ncbi:hypothetical protein [Mucilaginibacter sp. PAMB04168]|uniref:hypothetical protein n=1 Tax=Mucilaginibacter sp. PAMB04168 TaxID=3138567 RepID=UPI0031F68CC2
MKFLQRTVLALTACLLIFSSCKKNNDEAPAPAKPFAITDNFIAGTLTSRSGTKSTSVFFIQLLEDNKALFINSSSTNLTGTYTLTDTELTFEVTGGNARIARFALDKDKKVTSAYYKALTMEYDATGELLPVKTTNELAGKVFKGDEYKMGDLLFRSALVYNFANTSTSYGSGTDVGTIVNTANTYTLIGGSGFKYQSGSTTELGFVSGKRLTVFRSSGLSYYGKYDQQ